MIVMAASLTNSPVKSFSSNMLSWHSCIQNHHSRVYYYSSMNSSTPLNFQNRTEFHGINSRIVDTNASFNGIGTNLCCVNLLNGSKKLRKNVNLKFMVASIEYGFVTEQKIAPFIEDEVGGKQPFRGMVKCGSGSSNNQYNSDSTGGGMKLYFLEERDERELSKRILGLSRNNKKTSALQWFRSMEFSGLRPDIHACNSLLACLSRNNMLDDMLKVFAVMRRDIIVSGHSCSLVLKAVANHRGCDEVLQMFREWEVGSDMKEYFDAVVYNTVISICGKENNWVEMESIWEAMKENGIVGTEVTYRILVCTFVRCGQYEIAIDAYAEMLQNGLQPGGDVMHAVVGAYSKEEQWDMALSVFQNMLKCGLKPNLIACNALMNSLGKAGKLKEVFKVYEHIKCFGYKPDSYTWNALLAAFYRANQYANALQLFDSIQKDWGVKPNLQLYNTALMCCQRLGFWDKALQFLWKMENSGISLSTESYNIVIGACEVGRKPQVAFQVYERMVHENCTPDTFTHLSLIRSCIWGELWEEVEEILYKSAPNVSLYNAAIQGMCLKGRVESAKRLYMKMRDIGLTIDGKTRALMLQLM